jgi:hypothetical protein
LVKLPELSLEREKSEARGHGIASAILLGILLLVPVPAIKILAALPLIITAWKFVFHGSTAISMALEGKSRQWFQILVCVAVPLVMSLYFFVTTARLVPSVALKIVLLRMFDDLGLVSTGIIAIIAFMSWTLADLLNQDHPFRGFMIACTVIFAICFFSYNDTRIAYESCKQMASWDREYTFEVAQLAADLGRHCWAFLAFIAVSYVAMVVRMRHRRISRIRVLGRMSEESRRRLTAIEKASNRRLADDEFETWMALEESDSLRLKVISEYGASLEKTTPRFFLKEAELPFPKKVAFVNWCNFQSP